VDFIDAVLKKGIDVGLWFSYNPASPLRGRRCCGDAGGAERRGEPLLFFDKVKTQGRDAQAAAVILDWSEAGGASLLTASV